jgi:hypothetical protein
MGSAACSACSWLWYECSRSEQQSLCLGGLVTRELDTVQNLSLVSRTWELMQVKLPQIASWFPCFKTDTEVYLVIKQTLYSFTPLQVKAVKSLPKCVKCDTSYYTTGTLFYLGFSEIQSLEVGELTSL